MRMKTAIRILLALAGVAALVVAAIVFVIVRTLPSPGEIGRIFYHSRPPVTAAQNTGGAEPQATPGTEKSAAPVKPAAAPAAAEPNDDIADAAVLRELTDTEKPISDVCNYLKYAKPKPNQDLSKEIGPALAANATSDAKDPIVQSIKPVLRSLLTAPRTAELMKEIEEAAFKNKADSYVETVDFYRQAYAAFREMTANKAQIEGVMDRSYHLMIMAKIIEKRPDLLNDHRTTDYCRSIETALNQSQQVSFEAERKGFLEFVRYSGVDPKSIGFDPEYKTHVDFELSKQGLQMHGGWIGEMLKEKTGEKTGTSKTL